MWKDYKATIGDNTFSLSVDEWERPELTVETPMATRVFKGSTVNELFDEVNKLVVMDDPDLMNDLDAL